MGIQWISRGIPVLRWLHSFGIVFDIDGVLLRGKTPIEGASAALKRLHGEGPGAVHIIGRKAGEAQVPHVYLTNGGGVTEAAKAQELSTLLDAPVSEDQIILGHTPFRKYVNRYKKQRILTVGKGDTKSVMEGYGFSHVVPIEEYVHEFPDIDPLAQHGPARQTEGRNPSHLQAEDRRVAAVFVVSDPVNWGRDIQVLCDVLRSGGLPGHEAPDTAQVPLFFAADDFEYQAKFPVPRFGMGAFRVALESVFNRLLHKPLSHVAYGKPSPEPYTFALEALREHRCKILECPFPADVIAFDRVYMVGDNPKTDVQGALNVGEPWQPILTRTGVYRGHQSVHKQPDLVQGKEGPQTPVVATVAEAIDYILGKSSKAES